MGRVLVAIRGAGLLVAGLLFVIAAFAHGSWVTLCGIGLAIVALMMFLDEAGRIRLFVKHPSGEPPRRLRSLTKSIAFGAAAACFFLAAVVSSGTDLTFFALGFAAFAVAVATDHLADLIALQSVVRQAASAAASARAEAIKNAPPPAVPPAAPPAPVPVPAAAPPPVPTPPAPDPPAAAAAEPEVDAAACAKCGHALAPEDLFCPSCGAARA